MPPCFSKHGAMFRMTGGDPAGGIRAGVGTGWPHRIGWPAAVVGAGPDAGGTAAGAWGVAGAATGGATGCWAGVDAGAVGTSDRSGVGAGAGAGLAGLVRAGGVGPGMLDGAAGGGSLPGGVWAPAGVASHAENAAARRMRELSM